MLDVIDVNGRYEDEHGIVVIVGFVKHYVVWRRPGCAVNVCTISDFAKHFRKAVPERPRRLPGSALTCS